VPEAPLEDGGSGVAPGGEGWFVVNARDAVWLTETSRGSTCVFEGPNAWFAQLGFRICVLEPDQRNALYHSESQQEAFLVLSGECRLLVDDEERVLGPWDFFHCPAGTEHVFIGAGEGPCVIVMAGARTDDKQLNYPVSELAARYDASAREATSDPAQAYAGSEEPRFERPSYWDHLPWA